METWAKVLHSICNIGTHGPPDMYTLNPRARGPRGVHIRQTTHSYVTNTKCYINALQFGLIWPAKYCFKLGFKHHILHCTSV